MAKIYDWQIKKIVETRGNDYFRGMECEIYYKGKFIGTYGEYEKAACEIEYNDHAREQEYEELLQKAAEDCFVKHPFSKITLPDIKLTKMYLFFRLKRLVDDERMYKKLLKRGLPYVIIWMDDRLITTAQGFTSKPEMEKFIKEENLTIYRRYESIADFEIKD